MASENQSSADQQLNASKFHHAEIALGVSRSGV